ncbi:helix-turn-helix domain-containing protein [Acanthopleuribacter pedis]|uniref:Helix-turn-helix domain-containing protein n=1 Tax=Acanthopleuribacter pedis TaxID=442870 RepID=A0A8J7Q8T2_9BACT|nr:helix-turn-helix domain-containing protein [Acanthopleuribacter pedis]MBO1320010.1 helix-turn-helix domain-containing protein [Acanthopleuribacter pedis]
MTIGEKLKRARKKMNYDLDDVARETKIAKMFLIAIENDDVSALPGGVYTRNFLRTYAQFLELDEDIITAEFHDQYDIKPHFVLQQEQTKRDDSAFKQQRMRLLMVISLIVGVVLLVLLVLYRPWASADPAGAVKTLPPRVEAPGAASTSVTEPVSRPDEGHAGAVDRGAEAKHGRAESDPLTADKATATLNGVPSEISPEVSGDMPVGNDSPAARSAVSAGGGVSSGLPLLSLAGEQVLGGAEGDVVLDDVFVIEARRSVRVEVYIDGEMLTNRRLPAGERRIYRMGRLHVVKIWDIADVVVQVDGGVFQAPAGLSGPVLLTDFKPGEMLDRLRSAEVSASDVEE